MTGRPFFGAEDDNMGRTFPQHSREHVAVDHQPTHHLTLRNHDTCCVVPAILLLDFGHHILHTPVTNCSDRPSSPMETIAS